MSKTARISERIAILEREIGKSANVLGKEAGIGNGTVGGWSDNQVDKPNAVVEKFLRYHRVSEQWWKTGKGNVFITSVQDEPAVTEIPSGVNLDGDSKKLFSIANKTTEYAFVPKTILDGEYRIELKSEMDQRSVERRDTIDAYKKLVKKLEDEIAELRSGSLTAPQNAK